jgi:predicted enzyme related to lactoylglutathione lyase
MPAFTSYDPGTPCWVDIASTDIGQTTAFYGSLLGWECEDAGEEAGHYHVARLGGKQVAGIGPQMMEGQPCVWTTYVSVEDTDKSVEIATGAGATVLAPPMDVMTLGRMAVLLDPTGAAVSLWQPKDMPGAELANEPGAFAWNELNTRDVAGSKAFYSTLFGWQANSVAEGPEYYEWKLGDKPIAGMMPMPAMVPAQVPNHWLVYFAVADCDASAAKVKDLGGAVLVEPMTIPAGRFAVVQGLLQETFGIIAG